MKYVDEFRDSAVAKKLLARIERDVRKLNNPIAFMEVYGGYTHTIYRYGLENLLPSNIELIHGPSCPVCVIPMGRVDDAIWLAQQEGVIFTAFGGVMRVPGSETSLMQTRTRGADVRFVYSPLDVLKITTDNPDKQVISFVVGFETTAPSTAVTIEAARRQGVEDFPVFSSHVLIEPPLRAIVNGGETKVDGFIGPGHVATTTGTGAFEFLPREFNLPVAVTGFEPLDVLQAVVMLLNQFVSGDIAAGRPWVDNQYTHVVRSSGNATAQKLMGRVFALCDTFGRRGLGWIESSGLSISEEYAALDAGRRFQVPGRRIPDPVTCECGSVFTGHIKPWQCAVFGTAYTSATPIGTCVVSPEDACAAYYNFGRVDRKVTENLAKFRR